jgi:hypothetical protein
MGVHEDLEHAEHASHSHGAKHMGLTMAILGVLIAFCAAMVGSQRQELMTTLLDQSWAHSSWVAAAIKSEMVATDLQKLRGQPSVATNPALPRLLRLDSDYTTETTLAKEWDDACEPLIDAHYDAAEGYEHAQLLAEVGIIIASLAILLGSRMAWMVSLVVGALCLAQTGYTYVSARGEINEHHEKVHAAEHAYEEHSEQDLDSKGREEMLNELDPGGKIRATFPKEEAKAEHEPGKEEAKPEAAKPEAAKPEATKSDEATPEPSKSDE